MKSKKDKLYTEHTEQILVNVVLEYSWKEGYFDMHSFRNDVLERLKKSLHNDYPIRAFNILELTHTVRSEKK